MSKSEAYFLCILACVGIKLLPLYENRKFRMDNKNMFLAVAYKLYAIDEEGTELVEEAPESKPFQFITGYGVAMPAFEEKVAGLQKGEEFELAIPCSQAYGDHLEERVLDLDKEIFTVNGRFDHENIFVDATVPLQNEDGNRFMGTVLEITDDKVVMDLNHPLAGCDLRFVGRIVESREATNEEIQRLLNHMSGEGCGCGCQGCGEEPQEKGQKKQGCGCGRCRH